MDSCIHGSVLIRFSWSFPRRCFQRTTFSWSHRSPLWGNRTRWWWGAARWSDVLACKQRFDGSCTVLFPGTCPSRNPSSWRGVRKSADCRRWGSKWWWTCEWSLRAWGCSTPRWTADWPAGPPTWRSPSWEAWAPTCKCTPVSLILSQCRCVVELLCLN